MKNEALDYLACPGCKGRLYIDSVEKENKNEIEKGLLKCTVCKQFYEIKNYVPRFVSQNNYAKGFGLEWQLHGQTQYDSYTGVNVSEQRFFEETKWPRDMTGQLILEVGCGGGRFTEQAATTGATVVSVDYSAAVDSNFKYNGHSENVIIAQGDIYHLPVKTTLFDKVLCIGVLQHTPDPKKSFMQLPKYLKPGGVLVIDIYAKKRIKYWLSPKYWVRPLTRKIEPDKLYALCSKYIKFMWPISKIIHNIPLIGNNINWSLLVADYRGRYDLSEKLLMEWAILDTFDMLSPRYDHPETIKNIMDWFKDANLVNIEINYGYNGIEGRATKRN